jgi:putative endonuclease
LTRVERQARALALGRAGEEAAAALLQRRGYTVVGARFRARRGELDLICRRQDRLVVVEVKTRSSDAYGSPAEAVGRRKLNALAAAASEYRTLAGWRGPIDFALVSIVTGRTGEVETAELLEDCF